MLPYLVVMAAVLLVAAWIQIRIGLAPLNSVRRGVTDIRSGATRRLEQLYPDEVMPLVDEMNALLEAQEQTIERSRTWTADLAHGLKTPLMVLTADSQRSPYQCPRVTLSLSRSKMMGQVYRKTNSSLWASAAYGSMNRSRVQA